MNNVLSLVKTIEEYAKAPPCKKTVQKITYLVQEANEEYDFDYSIHFYGPYSSELDSEIRYRFNCGELSINDTNRGHLLSAASSEGVPQLGRDAQDVISRFASRTPSELELLATALYVQRNTPDINSDGIVNGVLKIKGAKYSKEQIEKAVLELQENHYF